MRQYDEDYTAGFLAFTTKYSTRLKKFRMIIRDYQVDIINYLHSHIRLHEYTEEKTSGGRTSLIINDDSVMKFCKDTEFEPTRSIPICGYRPTTAFLYGAIDGGGLVYKHCKCARLVLPGASKELLFHLANHARIHAYTKLNIGTSDPKSHYILWIGNDFKRLYNYMYNKTILGFRIKAFNDIMSEYIKDDMEGVALDEPPPLIMESPFDQMRYDLDEILKCNSYESQSQH